MIQEVYGSVIQKENIHKHTVECVRTVKYKTQYDTPVNRAVNSDAGERTCSGDKSKDAC